MRQASGDEQAQTGMSPGALRAWLVCACVAATVGACGKKVPPNAVPPSASRGESDDSAAPAVAGMPASATRTGASAAPVDPPKQASRVVVQDVGFLTPESMLHDTAADVYLVSNINGSPLAHDGNGFITRLSPAGKVAQLKWIDGAAAGTELNAPKGSAIASDKLYIADIDAVRVFARVSGKQQASINVPGATFVNDLCAGDDGDIYASDMGVTTDFKPSGTDAIYRIDATGKVHVVVKQTSLGQPNGLAFDASTLRVVTFGGGEVFALTLDQGRFDVRRPAKGRLDGVVFDDRGWLFVSSWEASGIYHGPPSGPFELAFGDLPSPADIGVDLSRKRLLIPLFNANKVVLQAF